MLKSVQWGKFRVGDLFKVTTPKKKFNANAIKFGGKYRYIARGESNNGIRGYITESKKFLNHGNTITFGQDTATIFYQDAPYFTGDKIKIFTFKHGVLTRDIAMFLIVAMNKAFDSFAWGSSSFNVSILEKVEIRLPITKMGKCDFPFMENLVRELELARVRELAAYLVSANLTDTKLTKEEEAAANLLTNGGVEWAKHSLVELFGNATRGKRLKSADRVSGKLPFVTAGERDTGISAYIGNAVRVFSKNTITIDMFGSAKYRNYGYGADDHVAVVHAEELPKFAVLFLTSAIHRVSNAGQFHYGRNFYASDADELAVMLPTSNSKPDYALMETLISAVQKLVINDVVNFSNSKIQATEGILRAQASQ